MKSVATTSTLSEPDDSEYQPASGFDLYFDFCSKMYHTFNQMRIVYTLQNITTSVIEPVELHVVDSVLDPADQSFNSFLINKSNLLKGIQAHPNINLIIEV